MSCFSSHLSIFSWKAHKSKLMTKTKINFHFPFRVSPDLFVFAVSIHRILVCTDLPIKRTFGVVTQPKSILSLCCCYFTAIWNWMQVHCFYGGNTLGKHTQITWESKQINVCLYGFWNKCVSVKKRNPIKTYKSSSLSHIRFHSRNYTEFVFNEIQETWFDFLN